MADHTDHLVDDLMADLKAGRLKLPTLPEVALKVKTAVEEGEADAAHMARLIGVDPSLSARLLQVANSPLYRGVKGIDSLQAAITRLGTNQVRNLVTSLLMKQMFVSRHPALRGRMQALWQHSTEVAAISHVVARSFTPLNPEQAMLAGLLHDIGALPILARAEQIPALAEDIATLDATIARLHTALGRVILETWKFAPELVTVVAEHENLAYDSGFPPDYVTVIIVANLHAHVGSDHRLAKVNWAEVPAFQRLGFTPGMSLKAMDEARQEIGEIQQLLAG